MALGIGKLGIGASSLGNRARKVFQTGTQKGQAGVEYRTDVNKERFANLQGEKPEPT